jgi:hypothetical protein
VEIVRDADGVPHIRAGSEADALFALGHGGLVVSSTARLIDRVIEPRSRRSLDRVPAILLACVLSERGGEFSGRRSAAPAV